MLVIKYFLYLLAALFLLVVSAFAYFSLRQTELPHVEPIADSEFVKFDDAYSTPINATQEKLNDYRASISAPSLSLAVAIDGEIVWTEVLGYANIKREERATFETVYPIGSVSKPITSALILKLAEQGVLDIDRDIRYYLPSFPKKKYPITLRQLLSHQAGVRHYGFALIPPVFSEAALNRQLNTTAEALEIFQDDPLLFEPDTRFQYSTYGYTLISAVIEAATGRDFLQVLEQELLAPLGMTHTSRDDANSPPQRRATDYVAILSRNKVIEPPATNSSYKWAGGGLVSTPSDLCRFAAALTEGNFLGDEYTKLMFTPRSLQNGEPNEQHYGLGWRIGGLAVAGQGGEEEILTLINHGGTSSGAVSVLLIVPDHNLIVAASANSVRGGGSGPITGIAAKIAREFIKHN